MQGNIVSWGNPLTQRNRKGMDEGGGLKKSKAVRVNVGTYESKKGWRMKAVA